MVHAIQEQIDQGQAIELGYASGYGKSIVPGITLEKIIADVEVDAKKLADIFGVTLQPDVDKVKDVWESGKLPAWIENFLVIVPWHMVSDSYDDAVRKLIGMCFGKNDEAYFDTSDNGMLPASSLIERKSKIDFFRRLSDFQKESNCLILPAQLGLRYRNVIPEKILEGRGSTEGFLGLYEVLCVLLLKSNRLKSPKDLHVGCLGDLFSKETFPSKNVLPALSFSSGSCKYYMADVTMAGRNLGVATAFTL